MKEFSRFALSSFLNRFWHTIGSFYYPQTGGIPPPHVSLPLHSVCGLSAASVPYGGGWISTTSTLPFPHKPVSLICHTNHQTLRPTTLVLCSFAFPTSLVCPHQSDVPSRFKRPHFNTCTSVFLCWSTLRLWWDYNSKHGTVVQMFGAMIQYTSMGIFW